MDIFNTKKIKELEAVINNSEILIKTLEEEVDFLNNKYGDIIDIENEIKNREEQKTTIIKNIEAEIEEVNNKSNIFKSRYNEALSVYKDLKKQISTFNSTINFYDFGLYEPIYDFDSSEKYKELLERNIESQKSFIKLDIAATCYTKWYINESVVKGRVMIKRTKQLMLRAFNGECDSLIAKVKWNNINNIIERFDKIFEKINQLGESNNIEIRKEYFDLKKEELIITYEHQLKKYKDKEEQRRRREEKKEEEKAQREFERSRRDAEREELYFQKALQKVKSEIEKATGAKYEALSEKISYLEQELIKANDKKERAISMAQQTRIGYVYIISNIGSFGENVYKIGMTRRLEPEERISELSNASVPFRYDIHALIFSEDAPTLERELHKTFDDYKVNMTNYRKEFFKVEIDKIEEKIKLMGIETDFIIEPEAREYRETQILFNKIQGKQEVQEENSEFEYPDAEEIFL